MSEQQQQQEDARLLETEEQYKPRTHEYEAEEDVTRAAMENAKSVIIRELKKRHAELDAEIWVKNDEIEEHRRQAKSMELDVHAMMKKQKVYREQLKLVEEIDADD